MPSATNGGQWTISADYKSPSGTRTFEYPQRPVIDNPSGRDNAKFFTNLRKGLLNIQADVNTFLTEKMEEDKSNADAAAASGVREDEEKEEANYGEEVDDEE